MTKKKPNLFTLFIAIVIIITVGIIILFILAKNGIFNAEKVLTNINITQNNDTEENTINESKYGIYEYQENLGTIYQIYGGCSVKNITYYVVYLNDEYYYYKSSCIGTYYLDGGTTSELEAPYYNEKTKTYSLTYKEKQFDKISSVYQIVPSNTIAKKLKNNVNLLNIKFLIEQSEFKGNYFDMVIPISNMKFTVEFSYKYNEETNKHEIKITRKFISGTTPDFQKEYTSIDQIPEIRSHSSFLAILDANGGNYNSNGYNYSLKTITKEGNSYDITTKFPLTINNQIVTLTNKSVYIKYDEISKVYKLVIADSKNVCQANNNGTSTYYVFDIAPDYLNGDLKNPELQGIYNEAKDCTTYNKIIGG